MSTTNYHIKPFNNLQTKANQRFEPVVRPYTPKALSVSTTKPNAPRPNPLKNAAHAIKQQLKTMQRKWQPLNSQHPMLTGDYFDHLKVHRLP
jgi:hypothetical protein